MMDFLKMYPDEPEGTAERMPRSIRVYDSRVCVEVSVDGKRTRKTIFISAFAELSNIKFLRAMMRHAIELRNELRVGSRYRPSNDMPTDKVLWKMFSDYKPIPVVVRKQTPYQPHETVIAAKRDVMKVLTRYGLL